MSLECLPRPPTASAHTIFPCRQWQCSQILRRHLKTSILLISLAAAISLPAQQIPVVDSLGGTNSLESLINGEWTNETLARVTIPGMSFRFSLTPLAYSASFDTAFLAALPSVTNNGIVIRTFSVAETNLPPRVRLWSDVAGNVVHTSAPPEDWSPAVWIQQVYGVVPDYLDQADASTWMLDRDPARLSVLVSELISTSDVPAYLTALSNQVAAVGGGTNISMLDLYSNDIICASAARSGDRSEVLVHAPSGVNRLDLFRSPDLSGTNWTWLGTLEKTTDPLRWLDAATNESAFFTVANPDVDSDQDGLPDGRERLWLHTPLDTADQDNDGVTDKDELLRYGTDPANPDTDGDSIPDGVEIFCGKNPTLPTTYTDVVTDNLEVWTCSASLNRPGIAGFIDTNSTSYLESRVDWTEQSASYVGPDKIADAAGAGWERAFSSAPDGELAWLLAHATEDTGSRQPEVHGGCWQTYHQIRDQVDLSVVTEADVDSCAWGVPYQTHYPPSTNTAPDLVSCQQWRSLSQNVGSVTSLSQTSLSGIYSNYSLTTNAAGTLCYSWSSKTVTHALTVPYSRAQFWTDAMANLNGSCAIQDPEWECINEYQPGTASSAGVTNGSTIALRRLHYRYSIANSEPGKLYRLLVAHFFTPAGATTSVVVAVTTNFAAGTSGTIYFPDENGVVVSPPGADGTIRIAPLGVQIMNPIGPTPAGVVDAFANTNNNRLGANVFDFDATTNHVCVIPIRVSISPYDDPAFQSNLVGHVTVRLQSLPNATNGVPALTWDNPVEGDPNVGQLVYTNGSWQATATYSGLPDVPPDSYGRVPAGLHELLYGAKTATVEIVGIDWLPGSLRTRFAPYELYYGENLVIGGKRMADTYWNYTETISVLTSNYTALLRREIYQKRNCSTGTAFSFATIDEARDNFDMRLSAIALMDGVTNGSFAAGGFGGSYYPCIGQTYYDNTSLTWRVGAYWDVSSSAIPDEEKTSFFQIDGTASFTCIQNATPFRGECAGFMQLIIFSAAANTMGENRFNAVHPHTSAADYMTIHGIVSQSEFLKHIFAASDAVTYVPGDAVYMKNKSDYTAILRDRGQTGSWQGENTLFMGATTGAGLFSGLGCPRYTQSQLRERLRQAYTSDCPPYIVEDPQSQIQFIECDALRTGE